MRYRGVMALLAFAVAGRTEDGGLRQAFERARYALQDSGHGSYRGANPAQRLTLEFDGREARLSHPDGSVSLHLSGYGYGERLRAPAPAALTGAGNRVEYRRGDLTEWYVNGSQGLEQGFTLARRPDTGGEGQPLVIALGVSGGLRPAQEADRAVLFGAALRYAGLKAVDARWRAMPSRLEARDGEIRLIVEDRDAQYPLVVDPTWTQQEELTASDGVANDLFGYSVSLSGDTALIGAYQKSGSRGAAYLFGRSGGVWSWEAEFMASDGVAGDQFGYFVSVSGETAVIGAPGTSGGQGAAYVFVRSAGAWGLQQELTASDGAAGDGFGSSVSVAGDTAVIGAYGRNSGQGAAYVFVRSGTSWSQQQELAASDGAAGDRLGCSASLSGYTAAIGACGKTANQGAVYVFVASGGVWSQQQKLTASDGATDYYFGNSVSVSGDTAVAGALNTSNGTGAAYVFVRSGGVWSQQQELTPPAGSSSYDFGNSVSVSGDTAIIGDWGGNGYRGVAYVFGRSGGVWSQQQRLTASDGAIDELGYSVSMSGDTVLIGAANGNSGRGAAYVFAFPRLGTSSLLVGSAAGASSVVLSYDGLWTATSNSSFLHIASGSASGGASGVVAFTYDAFAGTGWRTGTLTIAGLTLTVTQAGANYIGPGPLVTLVSSGLNQPMGVAVDGAGNVYIADYFNNAVKEWTAATQQISTLVAHGAPGYLSLPRGLAVDGAGNVYILNYDNYTVTEWSAATQQVTTLGFGGLYEPSGAAVDLFGNVYVTDDGHNKIEEWTFATQQVSTLVSSGLSFPEGVAVDASGNVYIADYSNGAIKEWSPVTQQVATLVSSGLSNPVGVAVDGSGNVYIADTYVQAIDEWNAATGQMSLLASSGLNLPYSVAVDVAGNVYIADTFNNAIKEIPNAFVGPASFIEPPLAGSDSLLPVIPATTNLTGVFAPTSDQSWLTIGPVANGIVGFSFTANPAAAARTAHINVLGHQIPVTQSAAGAATLSMGIGMGLGVAGAPDPAALQTDVSFDTTKLTFASASAGAALTSANKTLSAGVLPNGDVRLQTVGVDQTPISGGAVAKVTFIFNPAFTSGSASMTLKNCGASDTQGDGFTTTCATLAISGFTCDLNGDESVSVADVQIIINEALGVIPAVHDLNHDGLVNVVDVQKEINAALGLGCTY